MAATNGRRQAQPGAALKKLRVERGWTLADLSARTGLPVSSVSKMENGRTALTFDKLLKFSEALDVELPELFGSVSVAAPRHDGTMRRSVSRAGEGEVVETSRGNYLYLAAELLHKQFVPIIGDVLARDIASYGEYAQHEGEEFVYVLAGTLELHTEMYTPVVLDEGDSVYFDSGMRHAYIAGGSGPCRILSICGTPDPHLLKAMDAARVEIAPARAKPKPRARRPVS
jgi:transcriptional regulator with XRE-family HTH domain